MINSEYLGERTMNEIQGSSNVEKKPDKKKETLKGKIIRWSITLALCVGVFKFISGLQAEQKQEFLDKSRDQAMASCNADQDCRAKVDRYFDECIKGNYKSYKRGRFNRKYMFDLEGFKSCVSIQE
jgi:hypothetical protein